MTAAEATARHEAGHVAMAVVCGHLPVGAELIGDGGGRALSRRPLLRSTRERAREDALISLAGPLAQGAALAWPLGRTSDEKSVAASVETIAGDRDDRKAVFRELLADTEETASGEVYQRLELALASALERHGRLDQRGIAEVCGAVARSFDDDDERSDDMGHRKRISDRDRRDLDQFLDSLAKALSGTTEGTARIKSSDDRPPIKIKRLQC